MRISDWSSDVCSSDLAGIELHSAQIDEAPGLHADIGKPDRLPEAHGDPGAQPAEAERQIRVVRIGPVRGPDLQPADRNRKQARPADIGDRVDEAAGAATGPGRSEEHTSELQSLMPN